MADHLPEALLWCERSDEQVRIVKLKTERIVGIQDGYYVIMRPNGNLDYVTECKILSEDGQKVMFGKPNGQLEYSYSTLRKYPQLKEKRCELV